MISLDLPLIEERNLDANENGSSIIGPEKKSLNRWTVVPYTISDDVFFEVCTNSKKDNREVVMLSGLFKGACRTSRQDHLPVGGTL